MNKLIKNGISMLVVAPLIICGTSATLADPVEDWLAGQTPAAQPSISYDGAPIDWIFAHPAPPSSNITPVWEQGFDWLSKATEGKMNFKVMGSGTLLGLRDGFKGVRSGIAQAATCYTFVEGEGFPLSGIWRQPFVAPSDMAVLARIAAELSPKYMKPEFENAGVYLAYQAITSAYNLMSKKPVRSLADFKGLKIGLPGGDPAVGQALGAVFVQIPFPDLYTSLQQGVVDAIAWTDSAFAAYKISEIAKYHTQLDLFVQTIESCVNKDSFDSLPPDLKRAFYNFNQLEAFAIMQAAALKGRDAMLAQFDEAGVEMIVPSDADMNDIRSAVAPVVDKWVAEQEAAGIPAMQMIEDVKFLAKKYQGMTFDQLFNLVVTEPVPGIIDF
ncbi:MAG: TRAP transporter substrate-binding protein DctP [Rhizobiaceae bacterium]|nr:TRAP transporter substrate-binding protein DctP [Rhizobiaceae bacterium]